jgi:long-subunit fatty acid transport protein
LWPAQFFSRFLSRAIVVVLFCTRAEATEGWYYKNLLVGERASGLGGAFAAIADDPSGVWYNPAGLVMGRESYLSGSVNALHSSRVVYEDVLPGRNYSYHSQGLIPSFFGFTQELSPRIKAGFILMVRDSLSQEQDDEYTDLETSGAPFSSFSRQLIRNRDSYLVGPGISYQLSPRLMIGASTFAVYQNQRVMDFQRLLFIDPSDAQKRQYLVSNSYASGVAWGVMPKLGLLYIPHPRVSVGLTAAKSFRLAGRGRVKASASKSDSDGNPQPPTGDFGSDFETVGFTDLTVPLLAPWELTGALAWFPSDAWTISSQIDFFSQQKDFQSPVVSTLNGSIGAEWAGLPRLPLRFGIFTNSSSNPTLALDKTDQLEHVDQLGVSAGLSWVSPGSSVSLSGSYQWGRGNGQLLSGVTETQEVVVRSLTFYISGSYQL